MSIQEDFVTIGIHVYNMEDVICRCVYCALNQTYTNTEILIIDDGSTDNTIKNVEKKYKEEIKIGKIRIYKRNKNGGIPFASFDLVEQSRGKYIIFFDADDIHLRNRVEKQYNAIKNAEKQYPNKMIICFCGYYVMKDGKIKSGIILPDGYFEKYGCGTGCSMYRREDLLKMGNFDTAFARGCDGAMVVKMLQHNCYCANVLEPLFKYNHISNCTKIDQSRNDLIKYFNKLQKFFKKTSNNKYLDNFFGVYRKVFEFKLLWLIPFITIYYKCGRSIYICCIFGIPIIKYTNFVDLLNNIKIKQCELFGVKIYKKVSN